MASGIEVPIEGGVVRVRFTEKVDGDFGIDLPAEELADRRSEIHDEPWNWLRQVHGADYYAAANPGQFTGRSGDALMTVAARCPISVTTADCAPVVLVAERGVATIHAGWRGLLAGIIEATAAKLRTIAGEPVTSILGPCIHPEAYEFGDEDLAKVADVYGAEIRGSTAQGKPALNMGAAVDRALRQCGWVEPGKNRELNLAHNACTSGERWFSHRTRGDRGRQATIAWIEHD